MKHLKRSGDFERFGVAPAEFDAEIDLARSTGLGSQPQIPDPQILSIKERDCVYYPYLWVQLIHRALSLYVKARFRVRPLSRDAIVQGVLESLTDSTPYWVIRRDISSFYESVSTTALRPRLLDDTALPSAVRRHLGLLLDRHSPSGEGLPRGMGLAATLAELAMEDFDKEARSLPGVYRYFRFSDDILMFSLVEPSNITAALDEMVTARGMTFNMSKSYHVAACNEGKKATASNVKFEYLGYQFAFTDHCEDKKPRTVTVSIAPSKIRRIKTRMARSFQAFLRDDDVGLLTDRLTYLSSNFRIGPRRRGPEKIFEMRSGIYYNYRMCGVYGAGDPTAHAAAEVQDLDCFYHSHLNSRFSPLKHHLRRVASANQIAALRKLSFRAGFQERLMANFSETRFAAIQKAWIYAR